MLHLNGVFFHNPVRDWLVAALVGVGGYLPLRVSERVLYARLAAYAKTTPNLLDDLVVELVAATRALFLLALTLYVSSLFLVLPAHVEQLVHEGARLAVLVQAGFWASAAFRFWLHHVIETRAPTDRASATTLSVVGFVGRFVLWSVVSLLVLEDLGFNVSTLVAGLGVGGVAVALAVQNVLGDLFASLVIALDKPFIIGDFIAVDDLMGTVEKIGIKTTRVRSLSGEQLVFSHSDLLKSRLRNYQTLKERRVQFQFGILYETPADKVEAIPAAVREVITADAKLRFDRAHFVSFGDSALNFEVVYYVLDGDYNLYMDKQQAINVALMRRFNQEGIGFAYPTQTIYMAKG